MRTHVCAALWLFATCSRYASALALLPIATKPAGSGTRAPVHCLSLVLDGDEEFTTAQDEIAELRAKLSAAEATIDELTAPKSEPPSRFPLFRRVERAAAAALDELTLPKTRDAPSDGHLAFLAAEKEGQAHDGPRADASDGPVEQLFKKYDVDASGLLDLDEFRAFVEENFETSKAFVEENLETSKAFVEENLETSKAFVEGNLETVKSVIGRVNDLMPGATAGVPVTIVGGCGRGYQDLLSASGTGMPVEGLILAVERQAQLSTHLGSFLQLIVKIDQANMRTVRESWERHGRPSTLRELLLAEAAEGVIEPTRLREGSAALSLLWSMRMKRFWTIMADGFADQSSTEPSTAFGVRAYQAEVEPYHAFLLRNTFRTALRALPSRKEMLGNMAMVPPPDSATVWPEWEASAEAGAGLTAEERMAACLVELRQCSEATKRVTDLVQAQLDDLGFRDERKL